MAWFIILISIFIYFLYITLWNIRVSILYILCSFLREKITWYSQYWFLKELLKISSYMDGIIAFVIPFVFLFSQSNVFIITILTWFLSLVIFFKKYMILKRKYQIKFLEGFFIIIPIIMLIILWIISYTIIFYLAIQAAW